MSGMPACIHQIFYISATNFIFPLIFNIVLIIFNTTIVPSDELLLIGSLLWLINNYVTGIDVLCAMVWFSRPEWVRTRSKPLSDDMFSLKPDLQRVYDTGRECGSEGVMVGKKFATPDMTGLDTGPAVEEDKYCTV
ncbi:hypothetical protein F5J12DRAFT_547293 [Pisolithus orientalis]|uniref:uncharacterized protein n=1 Tax=Pisolithus orientalis TaxID=936130 RepID=UPI0022242560|nr:uncharacterized protein F5J12DRAFT_547293 [Pisolithus orientalis]KAI6012709.1 hypothetical protein F5J12DRAFT_547293 [Pisolithus orientalis]